MVSFTIFYKRKALVSAQIIGYILCLHVSDPLCFHSQKETVIGTGCMAKMQKVPHNTSNPLTHLVSARISSAFNLDLIWLFSMQGYLFCRTIHNLLSTVLISKRSEDFLFLEIGRSFPGRIFPKIILCR